MIEIITSLKDTPVPSLLVIGGFILLLLGFVGRFAGQIEMPPSRQRSAVIVGTTFMALGIVLYSLPNIRGFAFAGTPTATSQPSPAQPSVTPSTAPSQTQATSEEAPATPPTATTTALATQTPLPEGLYRLEETIYGRFDPNVPANVQLDEGRLYRFANERSGRYCRAEFPPDGLIWVLCIKIGKPEPTNTPALPPSRPVKPAATQTAIAGPTQTAAPTPLPTSTPSSVTYRVDVFKTSLEAMKTLPGCEDPAIGGDGKPNNACIVGPGGLAMEMHNLEFGRIYRFPSDVRQLYIGVSLRSTRIIVSGDDSGLPVITIGNNEFFAEQDQYYRIVVRKVE